MFFSIKKHLSVSFFCMLSICVFNSLDVTKANGQEQEIRGELWSGSIYSSTFRAGVCIDDNDAVHGVLLLRLKNGQEDVYHFQGNKNLKNVFHIMHRDGHLFSGKIVNATNVSGTLKTSKGFEIELNGKREIEVLLGKNCRPL